MRREALSLFLCCGSVSLPLSLSPSLPSLCFCVSVCLAARLCVRVHCVYIYLSWEVIASFCQQRSSVQEEGLSCSGSINSSISSTNCFSRLSSFPSSPFPFSLPPPTPIGGLLFIIFLNYYYLFFYSTILLTFFFFFFHRSSEKEAQKHTRKKHREIRERKVPGLILLLQTQR